MDQDREITDELEQFQSNITSLFRSVINDRNKYKEEKEKLTGSIESLMAEIKILRKENQQLKRSNNATSLCSTCSELRDQLMISNSKSKIVERNLDFFRNLFSGVPHNDSNAYFLKLMWDSDERKTDITEETCPEERSHSSYGLNNEVNKYEKEREFGQCDTFHEKREENYSKAFHIIIPEKKNNHDMPIIGALGEEGYLDLYKSDTETKASFEKDNVEFRTPRKDDGSVQPDFITSSFCSDFAIMKGERSPILVDQRIMINKNTFPVSPSCLKRKVSETASVSLAKFTNRSLFHKSPKQRKLNSPSKGSRIKCSSRLKNTNSIDVEISLAGVRKLKQTQLNPDYYRSRSQDDKNFSIDNDNENSNEEHRFGEDDVILESPKHSANYFLEFKKTSREDKSKEAKALDDIHSSASPVGEDFDPEETFVSSSFIRNRVIELKRPEIKNEPSPDLHERLDSQLKLEQDMMENCDHFVGKFCRSPEYNTVPNLYKGSPVRKRANRIRLPGQTCVECKKYYEAVTGETDPKKLQDILNRCSRHREHHYNIADTPPGYWKPYLTASMDGSKDKDDTQFHECA